MTLRDLPAETIRRRLKDDALCLETGPFVVSLRTPIASLAAAIATLYADFPVADDCAFADFHIQVAPRDGWRRWVRPQAVFTVGGSFRHDPFPIQLAAAFFEWGFNVCISRTAHQYLVLHGAVVERDDRATVLLGRSGAGKSTLCAALTIAGWRLLSDELTLIVPGASTVVPLTRPIGLKNESIDVVRALAPDATFGPPAETTRKGLVAHLCPPRDSVRRMREPAHLSRFVFVEYAAGAAVRYEAMSPGLALTAIVRQSFNYGIRGRQGFDHLTQLVSDHPAATLTYGRVEDAVELLNRDDFPNGR